MGIGRDQRGTAHFAVAAIRRWWKDLGPKRYPTVTTLTITANCGGSDSYRIRLWKTELQKRADHVGLEIRVMHYPPGTSKVEQNRAPPVQLHLDQLDAPNPSSAVRP